MATIGKCYQEMKQIKNWNIHAIRRWNKLKIEIYIITRYDKYTGNSSLEAGKKKKTLEQLQKLLMSQEVNWKHGGKTENSFFGFWKLFSDWLPSLLVIWLVLKLEES